MSIVPTYFYFEPSENDAHMRAIKSAKLYPTWYLTQKPMEKKNMLALVLKQTKKILLFSYPSKKKKIE